MAPMAPAMVMALDMSGEQRMHDRRLDAAGKLTVDELIELRAASVTPEYMKAMRATFSDLTIGELIDLGASGVTREWLDSMRNAGVEIRNAREAVRLRAAGVEPNYIRDMEQSRKNR